MCVNNTTMKCCGSCSLTDATIVLGVFYGLYAISSAASRQWFHFIITLIACVLFIAVCVKKSSVVVRKMLFILVTIMQTISLLGLIIVFIIIMATSWIEDLCIDGDAGSGYDSLEDCESYIRMLVGIGFGIGLVLTLLLCWCEVQILYYGWKEQEMLAGQKTNPGMVETAQMPYQQVQGKGDQSVAQGQPV